MTTTSRTNWILIIVAFGSMITTIIQSIRTNSQVAKVADNIPIADKKLNEIHQLTNSSWTKAKDDLGIANARIEKLERMLDDWMNKNRPISPPPVK